MRHCRMWSRPSLLGKSQVKGKHLGRLTFTWKEKNGASGERPGLSGISDCGGEGRQASRRGKHMATWCHNSPLSIFLSELHTPTLPLAKPVFPVWGPRSRDPELFSRDTKVTPCGSTANWLPSLLVKCAVLPNLSLTKPVGIIPVFLMVFIFLQNSRSNIFHRFIFLFSLLVSLLTWLFTSVFNLHKRSLFS